MKLSRKEIIERRSIFIIDDYYRHNELKKDILTYLLVSPDKHNKKTYVKAKMTDWSITSPEIEILKKEIINNCIHEYDHRGVVKEVVVQDFWGNVYEKGDYASPHHHLPSMYSFVYFLKSKPNYSPLVFGDRFWNRKSIKPKEGRFVIFPCSTDHSVPKHKHKEKRVTLSGNINFIL
jgi:hypothetical protein